MRNTFIIEDDAVRIKLERRNGDSLWTVIDLCDFPTVASVDGIWRANWSPGTKTHYVRANIEPGKPVLLHRLLTNAPKGLDVDHQNHDGLDNRRSCNLRVVTRSVNLRNRRVPPKPKPKPKRLGQPLNYCRINPVRVAALRQTHTLQQVADLYGVSRQRIHQIHLRARKTEEAV